MTAVLEGTIARAFLVGVALGSALLVTLFPELVR